MHVTGPAGSIADLVDAFGGIDSLLLLVALAVVFVILVLVYRSPSLPFTVLFTSLFALPVPRSRSTSSPRTGVLVLNGQSQGILFILVVGAATDYSLLIVARYREELRWVPEPPRAMFRALRASLEPGRGQRRAPSSPACCACCCPTWRPTESSARSRRSGSPRRSSRP